MLNNNTNGKGERLYVANDKGVWLITDNSLNMTETETTNKITARTDMDKVMTYLKII